MPQRLIRFLGWPIIIGAVIGLLVLLFILNLRALERAAPTAPPQAVASYADAVARAAPAVVNIYAEKRVMSRQQNLRNHPFYRHLYDNSALPLQERMEKTLGSGVIVDGSGLILTNHHVIRDAEHIAVLLYDGRYTSATLIGMDEENDLAVLKIDARDLYAIPLGDSTAMRVGDVVLAIGNPFGVGQSVTQGIVSATGRWNVGISQSAVTENFIQTDAAINPGNSGGALIDAYGNLIGINTAVLDESNSSAGISFAVPVATAMESLRQIALHGRVIHGWIGIEGATRPEHSGIFISGLYSGGPAHRAGVALGDTLTHINGVEIRDERHCLELVNRLIPGAKASVRVLRDGHSVSLEIIPGERGLQAKS